MGIIEFRDILLQLNADKNITILISSHILSELSNLATHYGFIEKGRMIQQISAKEISERCRECLELVVDDTTRAAVALEQRLNCEEYEIFPENTIRIYAFLKEPALVTRALTDSGVAISAINTHGSNLEEYYLSLLKQADGAERRGSEC